MLVRPDIRNYVYVYMCMYPAGRICPKWLLFTTSCLSLRLFGHCLIVSPIGCFTWSATEKPTSTAESSTRLSYRGTFPFSARMLYNCGVRDIWQHPAQNKR